MNRNILLPNIITGLNFLFGTLALILIYNEEYILSVICVFLAMLCDFLDGQVARRNNSTSKFGFEFDSLSDLVSFGIVPGMLAYSYYLRDMEEPGVIIASVYMLCTGIRLAKFNSMTKSSGKKIFYGLPSPAAAGVVCSTFVIINKYESLLFIKLFPLVVLTTGLLMVSNVKYPVPVGFLYFLKNKIKGWYRIGFACFILILLFNYTEILLSSIFMIYLTFGLSRALFSIVSENEPVKAYMKTLKSKNIIRKQDQEE